MSKTYSAGIVTAYGAAKRAGYQGTYEDFCRQQAGYAESAAAVEVAKNTAVSAANTATTKATEATTAATAAQTAKTQTEAAASQALMDIATARSGAISAVQTEGATQTANARSQAQAAAQSATTASTKASEASASATSAGQSATNAAASATSAANAASEAQGVLESIPQDYADLSADVTQLKADLGALDENLESQQILQKTYIPVKVIESATINSSGVIVGTAGFNVYVYKVQSGKNIRVTGGYVYALFADEPVKTTSQSIDSVSHQGSLSNTAITMPSGANYIAVRNTTASTVVADVVPLGVSVNALESDVEGVQSFLSTPLSFSFNGFINSSGVFVSNNAYRATDYVPVANGGTYIPLKYRVKVINTVQFAFYDGQKAFIKAVQLTASTSLVEVEGVLGYVSGAVYVRLCSYSGSGNTQYSDYYADYSDIKNTVTGIIPYPTDYAGSEISVFNKILCIGDSLTSGTFNYRVGSSTSNYIEDAKYSYPTYLKKITGCDVTNLGNGGKTSLEWYNLHVNDDLSGYDCAIIQLGVNDVGRYDTWGQDSIDGFSGIISKLKTENANIKIFVSNIIPARSYHTDGYISMSDAIKAYIEGLNDPQIILLDMQQYGHTYDSAAYNCGHLSALGYQRLAQDYKSYISYHVFMHKTDFKEVQFIGTDYYYDPIA